MTAHTDLYVIAIIVLGLLCLAIGIGCWWMDRKALKRIRDEHESYWSNYDDRP